MMTRYYGWLLGLYHDLSCFSSPSFMSSFLFKPLSIMSSSCPVLICESWSLWWPVIMVDYSGYIMICHFKLPEHTGNLTVGFPLLVSFRGKSSPPIIWSWSAHLVWIYRKRLNENNHAWIKPSVKNTPQQNFCLQKPSKDVTQTKRRKWKIVIISGSILMYQDFISLYCMSMK